MIQLLSRLKNSRFVFDGDIVSLQLQQEAFGLYSASITDQLMVAADDSVAWDQYGNGIGAIGGGDGSCGFGIADRLGQLRIRASLAVGNSLERLPNPVLKRGAGKK